MKLYQFLIFTDGNQDGIYNLPTNIRPEYVWLLPDNLIKKIPQLPYFPLHFNNALLQDFVHDWKIVNNTKIKFYPYDKKIPNWILVEYSSPIFSNQSFRIDK